MGSLNPGFHTAIHGSMSFTQRRTVCAQPSPGATLPLALRWGGTSAFPDGISRSYAYEIGVSGPLTRLIGSTVISRPRLSRTTAFNSFTLRLGKNGISELAVSWPVF